MNERKKNIKLRLTETTQETTERDLYSEGPQRDSIFSENDLRETEPNRNLTLEDQDLKKDDQEDVEMKSFKNAQPKFNSSEYLEYSPKRNLSIALQRNTSGSMK